MVGGKTRGRVSEITCFMYLTYDTTPTLTCLNSSGHRLSPVGLGQEKFYRCCLFHSFCKCDLMSMTQLISDYSLKIKWVLIGSFHDWYYYYDPTTTLPNCLLTIFL